MVPYSSGKLMTMRQWLDCVTSKTLTDLDGYGYYSNGEEVSLPMKIYPTLVARRKIDTDWSHVVWFEYEEKDLA